MQKINCLAIELCESVGISMPTQEEIDQVEQQLMGITSQLETLSRCIEDRLCTTVARGTKINRQYDPKNELHVIPISIE